MHPSLPFPNSDLTTALGASERNFGKHEQATDELSAHLAIQFFTEKAQKLRRKSEAKWNFGVLG